MSCIQLPVDGGSSLALVGDDMTSVGHVNSVDGSTGV